MQNNPYRQQTLAWKAWERCALLQIIPVGREKTTEDVIDAVIESAKEHFDAVHADALGGWIEASETQLNLIDNHALAMQKGIATLSTSLHDLFDQFISKLSMDVASVRALIRDQK